MDQSGRSASILHPWKFAERLTPRLSNASLDSAFTVVWANWEGSHLEVICLDLEGVLVPEVWISLAEATGIHAFRRTTRDIPDYDELMTYRLNLLQRHNLGMSRIRAAIESMTPLPGAKTFLAELRERFQVIILSDTFYEFAGPLMRQLGWPTLFCHRLSIQEDRIVAYHLRQKDPKRRSVQALHQLQYTVYAAGDSYNDIAMLEEADAGVLFNAPQRVVEEHPQFPLVENYDRLLQHFIDLSRGSSTSTTTTFRGLQ